MPNRRMTEEDVKEEDTPAFHRNKEEVIFLKLRVHITFEMDIS